jgi:hypothetical protein
MATIDTTRSGLLSKRDWTIIVCGALVLVASFLPWESATSGLYTGSDSAWNAGFAAWFGSLLAAAAAAAVVARHLGHLSGIRGVGPNLAACALAVAALVFLGLRLLTLPHGGTSYGTFGTTAGYGPSFGAYAGVGFAAVQAVAAVLNVRATGEKIPSSFKAAATPPASPMPGPQAAAYSQPSAHQPSGPTPAPGGTPEVTPQYPDQELAQRLARLDNLRANGLISDTEHTEQRRRIISQL